MPSPLIFPKCQLFQKPILEILGEFLFKDNICLHIWKILLAQSERTSSRNGTLNYPVRSNKKPNEASRNISFYLSIKNPLGDFYRRPCTITGAVSDGECIISPGRQADWTEVLSQRLGQLQSLNELQSVKCWDQLSGISHVCPLTDSSCSEFSFHSGGEDKVLAQAGVAPQPCTGTHSCAWPGRKIFSVSSLNE